MITVTTVDGTPTFMNDQKPKGQSCLAQLATMRLATLPTKVKFPANVLAIARTNQSNCAWCASPTQLLINMTNGTLPKMLLPTTVQSENRDRPERLFVCSVTSGIMSFISLA